MATQPKQAPMMRAPRKQTTPARDGLSMWAMAWRRFRRSPKAMLGLYVLVALVLAAVFAPLISNHSFEQVNLAVAEHPPTANHWLGTDELGRDVFARLMFGGRISLSVGLVAVAIYLAIGIVLGAAAGFYGGWTDNVIMRITDVVMVIPFFPLALTMAVVLKPSLYNTMIILGMLGWTVICRLVRGEFLSLRKRDFVEAATAEGAGDLRIIFRHILPNSLAPIVVAATLGVAEAVLAEAGLSFLGFGVQQPTPSWGNMLSSALSLKVLVLQPWLWIPPGTMIFIAVLAVNLVGDGLRDSLDPRLKQ
jgi:peptide/nickel transport system permease protein